MSDVSNIPGAGELANKIYDDLLSPSAKVIGETASLLPRTIKVLFTPWEQWVIKGESNLEEVALLVAVKHEANGTPEKDIVAAPNYIGVPAMQAISYSMDSDELKNMFANLLAKATNINTRDSIHPSFIEIIKRLSPLEAILLQHFKKGINNSDIFCAAEVRIQEVKNYTSPRTIFFDSSRAGFTLFPVLINYDFDFTVNIKNHLNSTTMEIVKGDNYIDKDTFDVGINNLLGLNLLNLSDAAFISKDHEYLKFLNNPIYMQLGYNYLNQFQLNETYYQVSLLKKSLYVTPYGKSFMYTCLD